MSGVFPFGSPVRPCAADVPERTFATLILGAYPRALHVRWTPPAESGLSRISALAVDNEPQPFWDGTGADALVEEWRSQVFRPEWGTITSPPALSGPSGDWVRKKVIQPMAAEDCFITDCLTTYRTSRGQAERIRDTYTPFATTHRLPAADLPRHPTEDDIVREAVAAELPRLMQQVGAARPQLLISLGNAAARVVARLAGAPGMGGLESSHYGESRTARIAGHDLHWLPLIHPAAPPRWQKRHEEWIEAR